MIRHFLAPDDLSPTEQARAIDLAAELTKVPYAYRPFSGPRSVAIISDKPTLRTQLSFQAGIAELGGNPLMVDGRLAGIGTRESIADSARVLGRQVAQIVWRTGEHSRITELAQWAGVPVINALTDDHHPCQVLADLLTIAQHRGDGTAASLRGLPITYLGDGANNMSHSYLLGGALAGMSVTVVSPPGYQPSEAVVSRAEEIAAETGAVITVTEEPGAYGATAVITDTWVSMGQDGAEERAKVFAPYSVTSQLMDTVPDAIAMHCLPAYRGKEIAAEVLDGPRSVVWDEAANRLPVQKAVMIMLDEMGEAKRRGRLMSAPTTKAARQNLIITLVGGQAIRSQSELAELLNAHGIEVSQGTLSKDLLEIGAMRVRSFDGQLIYAVPGEGGDRSATAAESGTFEKRLARVCEELLVSAQGSANLAILRTPPGAAQYVASAIDRVAWTDILGTIAGDDTVMVISRAADGGEAMAQRFLELNEDRQSGSGRR